MIGYFLAGILATACGFLLWVQYSNAKAFRDLAASYEARIELLRRENGLLLHTALEAKGVQVIDPSRVAPPQATEVIRQGLRSNIRQRMAKLAEDDRKKAMDRDARVAEEIEQAKRDAEEARAAMKGGTA